MEILSEDGMEWSYYHNSAYTRHPATIFHDRDLNITLIHAWVAWAVLLHRLYTLEWFLTLTLKWNWKEERVQKFFRCFLVQIARLFWGSNVSRKKQGPVAIWVIDRHVSGRHHIHTLLGGGLQGLSEDIIRSIWLDQKGGEQMDFREYDPAYGSPTSSLSPDEDVTSLPPEQQWLDEPQGLSTYETADLRAFDLGRGAARYLAQKLHRGIDLWAFVPDSRVCEELLAGI